MAPHGQPCLPAILPGMPVWTWPFTRLAVCFFSVWVGGASSPLRCRSRLLGPIRLRSDPQASPCLKVLLACPETTRPLSSWVVETSLFRQVWFTNTHDRRNSIHTNWGPVDMPAFDCIFCDVLRSRFE